jgi:hypothetical protein
MSAVFGEERCDFSLRAMQLARKRRNLLVGRTPVCNNTLREP